MPRVAGAADLDAAALTAIYDEHAAVVVLRIAVDG
jgi:hypothetical protein